MSKRFSDGELRRLRNEVPFPQLLASLGWPHRRSGDRLLFVCPRCGESRSDLNPQENLVRCFHCHTNFNPIDFTMAARDCDFVEAVHYLLSLVESKTPP